MTSVRQLWRSGRIAVLALLGWLTIYSAASAQPPAKPNIVPTLNSTTYVFAYFLVIFGIALGMLFVCRSSNRRERAKPEQFVGTKMAEGEEEE
jgi:heme/copper-type cytochrome/quinol oxidase subunit 2